MYLRELMHGYLGLSKDKGKDHFAARTFKTGQLLTVIQHLM